MRPVSAGRARAQRERVARLRATTHGPVRCQWPLGCAREASDAHESLSRARGGDPLDPDWLLCRPHHDSITSASGELLAWAKSVGLIRSSADLAGPTIGGSATARTAAPALDVADATAMTTSAQTYTVTGVPKMTRPRIVTTRVTREAGEWLDSLAEQHGLDVATVVRVALAVSSQHAPELGKRLATIKENG